MAARPPRKAQRRSGSCSCGATGRTGPDTLPDRLSPNARAHGSRSAAPRRVALGLGFALLALPLLGGLSWLQKLKQVDKAVIGIGEHAAAIDALVLDAQGHGRPRNLDAIRSEQVQLDEQLDRAEKWLGEIRASESPE